MTRHLRKLEGELAQLDEAIGKALADRDRAEARWRDAGATNEQLPSLDADVALGDLSPDEATIRRHEILTEIGAAWHEHDRLTGAVAELRRRAADVARKIGEARAAAVSQRVADAEAKREEAERRLEAAEREEREARKRVAEVEEESLRRLARYDDETEKRVGDRRRQENEQIRWAVSQGPSSFEMIPEHLRPEAQRLWDEKTAPEAVEARREAQLEGARQRGEGVIENGEVVVEPELQRVLTASDPSQRAPWVERLRP